ncbi:hypothetical protein EXIGLDRAFT_725890 [Exidia glandulosa HHB12029]|uniref:Uncharacterized protein n=1 Tax=Exidia glandulosa HHB12029 TaxID=1314781 RepID=A0A165MH95_EXIGL|nr:hypothetical protein EXIGLDRAFT_725890 [Exidia glandulosa HHB12029]
MSLLLQDPGALEIVGAHTGRVEVLTISRLPHTTLRTVVYTACIPIQRRRRSGSSNNK